MPVPQEKKDEVVRRYRDGEPVEQIMSDLDLARSTVYYILRSRGVKPSRVKRTGDPSVSLQDVIDQLVTAERNLVRTQSALMEALEHIEDREVADRIAEAAHLHPTEYDE